MSLGKIKQQKSAETAAQGPDQFIAQGNTLVDRVLDNPKIFGIIIVGVLVAAVLGIVIVELVKQNHRSVGDAFATAQETYNAPVVAAGDTPPEGSKTSYPTEEEKYAAVEKAFTTFIDKHGGSSYAPLAYMYLGVSRMELKQYDKASEAFKAAIGKLDSGQPLFMLASKLLGQSYEEQEKWEDALKQYQIVTGAEKSDYLKDMCLYYEGRMLERLGKKPEALAAYAKMKEAYPKSSMMSVVDKRKSALESELGPATPAPAAPTATP